MKATALLTSFCRQSNLQLIIESLKAQTAEIEIFLWNNNPLDQTKYDVDLQINSSKNLMCLPRWFMSNYASSEYVFTLDDDLIFKDNNLIADCIEYSKSQSDKSAIGICGIKLNDEKQYWDSKRFQDVTKDTDVDILIGRFIFSPKTLINLGNCKNSLSIEFPRFEDDIFVSSLLEKKTIPKFLRHRIRNLNEGSFSLFKQSEHKDSRTQQCLQYFKK